MEFTSLPLYALAIKDPVNEIAESLGSILPLLSLMPKPSTYHLCRWFKLVQDHSLASWVSSDRRFPVRRCVA